MIDVITGNNNVKICNNIVIIGFVITCSNKQK